MSRRLVRGIEVGVGSGFVALALFGFPAGVRTALATGIGFGTLAQFGGESWSPEADLTAPHDGLRRERRSSMLAGLVAGLSAACVASFAPAPLGGLRTGLSFGLVVGTATGLASGALWIRYAVGVWCAKMRERLPLPLESFMKWACDSGLLRTAGTAYQFRHRQLQDWLVQKSGDST